ncbi:MAG: CHAT domain-containing protein, partial [Leptolyngbya sp. SIO4C5]|nr:CHAT domain-containing protein [Leptolyngbya sp. SIO4C5]
ISNANFDFEENSSYTPFRNRLRGFALYNIGIVYLSQKDFEAALSYFKEAEVYGSIDIEGIKRNIGIVYFELGKYSEALEAFEEALNIRIIGDPGGHGLSLNRIGLTYVELQEYDLALESYQQALNRFRNINDPAGESLTLRNIAALMERQNQPELAIAFYKQSVNLIESIRQNLETLPIEVQRSYLETVADTYRHLADLLLQQDRILEAQRVLDLLKVQELDDYLRGIQRNANTEQGIALRPEEQTILELFLASQDRLVEIGREEVALGDHLDRSQRTDAQQARLVEVRQIQQLQRQQFQTFIDSEEIQTAIAQLSRTTDGETLKLGQLNNLRDNLVKLDQQAVVLYPLILDDRLELILVTPYSPPIRRTAQVSRVELNQAIADFRSALQSPSSDAIAPAQQLYEWLIKPIEADLQQAEAETLIYAPDGQLRYIPLAALHDGSQWLTERFRVNNITAASIDDLDNEPDTENYRVLAAALTEAHEVTVSDDVLFFPALTYAAAEVANLATLIPTTDQRLDSEFNKSLVYEFNDYSLLHLATHATFVPGAPENSFILFGNGDRATLSEIESWDFPNVELVVLSACETGVGDQLGDGKEILGFGYLMQLAGAEAAIASLWQVSDGGTQALMDAFYAALQSGHTKAEALQLAQRALITNDFSIIEAAQFQL